MCIERVIVKNYQALASLNLAIRPHLNVIVGNNETGKSTLLEAVNLALRCQLNRRPAAAELHTYLFNTGCVKDFVTKLRGGLPAEPARMVVVGFPHT